MGDAPVCLALFFCFVLFFVSPRNSKGYGTERSLSKQKGDCFGGLFPQFADVSMPFVRLSAMKKCYCRWGHCWNGQSSVTGMLLFLPLCCPLRSAGLELHVGS